MKRKRPQYFSNVEKHFIVLNKFIFTDISLRTKYLTTDTKKYIKKPNEKKIPNIETQQSNTSNKPITPRSHYPTPTKTPNAHRPQTTTTQTMPDYALEIIPVML